LANPPEEVVAVQTAGFAAAHAIRVKKVRLAMEKQWNDDDRVRRLQSPRMPRGPQVKKLTDLHLVERIREGWIREREEAGRKSVRVPLPREDRAFERGPKRMLFFG
jgi:hypothetical protein